MQVVVMDTTQVCSFANCSCSHKVGCSRMKSQSKAAWALREQSSKHRFKTPSSTTHEDMVYNNVARKKSSFFCHTVSVGRG